MKRAFVNTYRSRSFSDAWAMVEAYEAVQRTMAKNPERGSAFIAHQTDLPRSAIRRWVDENAVPYPYQGLQTALEKGWLDLEAGDEMTRALLVLCAHVLGDGSIKGEKYTPSVSAGWDVDLEEIHQAFAAVGVRTKEHTVDDPDRATQVRPSESGSVLGRVLVVLGLPAGGGDRGAERLPPLIWDVDIGTQSDFLRTYLRHRGPESDAYNPPRFLVNRPDGFRRELATLLTDVTGAEASTYERGVIVLEASLKTLAIEVS
jgi:hypothetical protein